MFCGKCGAEVLEGAKFCDKCGAVIEVEQVSLKQKEEKVDVKTAFIDPDEELVEKIGNGYLFNLLHNEIRDCALMLTNKRVYLKGELYTGSSKTISKTVEERVLDVEDITGTGFIYDSVSWITLLLDALVTIIGAVIASIVANEFGGGTNEIIIMDVGILLAGIFLAVYIFMSRKTFFFIDYAGGRIMINAKLVGVEDVRDFHKQMRRVKDNIKGKLS